MNMLITTFTIMLLACIMSIECETTQSPTNGPIQTPPTSYYWVATNGSQGVPSTAVQGGIDKQGYTVYAGRAIHAGNWIPAKVIPEQDAAYVTYRGKEYAKSEYQILCEQRFDWVPTNSSNIPLGAVKGGNADNGEVLYVGRVFHKGLYIVGKVHPSHKVCYVPFKGEEISYINYEILVLRG